MNSYELKRNNLELSGQCFKLMKQNLTRSWSGLLSKFRKLITLLCKISTEIGNWAVLMRLLSFEMETKTWRVEMPIAVFLSWRHQLVGA